MGRNKQTSSRSGPPHSAAASPWTPGCIIPNSTTSSSLARAFPATSIILCHVGGPLGYGPYVGKGDEVFAAWHARINTLATCPNVVVKLGGMLNRLAAYETRALPAPVSSTELAAYWRPYMTTCIERFGADRCMFESNFPVEKMGGRLGHALECL